MQSMSVNFFIFFKNIFYSACVGKAAQLGLRLSSRFIYYDDVRKVRTTEWVRWFSFAHSSFHAFPQFVQQCSIPD